MNQMVAERVQEESGGPDIGLLLSSWGQSPFSIDTAPTIQAEQLFDEIRTAPAVPLWEIRIEAKRVRIQPISVTIYRDGDFFFAENENLAICGTGSTPSEALHDLGHHISYFYKHYKNLSRKQLTGDALRLKDLYENLLLEEA
jgi:hypothetical protein